jgi:hypothetical protein
MRWSAWSSGISGSSLREWTNDALEDAVRSARELDGGCEEKRFRTGGSATARARELRS